MFTARKGSHARTTDGERARVAPVERVHPQPGTGAATLVADAPRVATIERLLVAGERLAHSIEMDNRWLHVTSHRIVVIEKDGDWSVIPTAQIGGVEVSDAFDGGRFVKIWFGGGLDRTFRTRTARDAELLAGAVVR